MQPKSTFKNQSAFGCGQQLSINKKLRIILVLGLFEILD
ncbi:hypothetical protein CRL705_687 [Latilactobacillus curvatus CRL 705]|nr:hypothetical protein CRL705_687 [Latilactobacillus curvatus CRL 705]